MAFCQDVCIIGDLQPFLNRPRPPIRGGVVTGQLSNFVTLTVRQIPLALSSRFQRLLQTSVVQLKSPVE